ncbi:disease resistance protein RPM1 [Vigna unguiculata]|uniref:Disease resistance protein RPM1 n=1 Tax=Vigna unguiculata TaxID=3917 RepID=A0A4D6NI17_VIGUN|nr:disease resistance protein RPM1 [Vigna unguiculata]
MSIPTNKMKAVALLLKRVKTARRQFRERGRDESLDGNLEKLRRELNKIRKLFEKVKNNEQELLHTLSKVDGHLRTLDSKRLNQDMNDICKRIRDSAQKLLPKGDFDDSSGEEDDDRRVILLHPSRPSSKQHKNQLPQHKKLNMNLRVLETYERNCLLSLLVFPEGAVIKKRQTIYWWIGEGFLESTELKTAEEEGEDVIDKLLKSNVILAYGNRECPIVNKFQINPLVRPKLVILSRENHRSYPFPLRIPYSHIRSKWSVLEQKKVTLGENSLKPESRINTIFNVGASYLNFGSQWLDKSIQNLKVLQLGRWQDSPSHHIEVGSEKFLQKLQNQKNLTYFSLRGISRISELPPSITLLERLQILDLKACHNLETLPNDISSMKSMTHLILSQCYLLEGMPKGIEKLTQLQVLEGYVVGNSRKSPQRISELANLKNLKRLSIHIGSEAVIKEGEFESWREMLALEQLKISWGVSCKGYSDIKVILPLRLKRLHLEGFPGDEIPEWLKPSKLPEGCKELKLMGGMLKSMNHEDNIGWRMEIVRLMYLKHLKLELTNLSELFPLLRYAEIKQNSKRTQMLSLN